MGSSSFWIGITCIAIGSINVLLNFSVKRAADQSGTYWDNLLSPAFLLAFLVGCGSIIAIFTLYSLKIELGRAILLMGASSIVGGSLFAVAMFGTELKVWEKAILALIALFYILKMTGK